MRIKRIAAQRDDRNMVAANAWFRPRYEVLIAEHGIERNHTARGKYPAHATIDAAGKVRELPRRIQWLHLPHRGHRRPKLMKLMLQPFALPLLVGGVRYARQQESLHAVLDDGWRAPRHGEHR